MASTSNNKRGPGRPRKNSTSTRGGRSSGRSKKNKQSSLLNPAVRRAVSGLILLALSLFLLFSILTDSTGFLGGFLHRALCGSLGLLGALAAALALLYIGVQLLKRETRYSPPVYTIACGIGVVCISALQHSLLLPDMGSSDLVATLYETGVAGTSGGVLGGGLAIGMIYLFGRFSTSILLTILLLCCLVVLTQLTPYMLYASVISTAQKAQSARQERQQQRMQEQAVSQEEEEEKQAEELIRSNRLNARVDIPLPATQAQPEEEPTSPQPEPSQTEPEESQPSEADMEREEQARSTVELPSDEEEELPWEEPPAPAEAADNPLADVPVVLYNADENIPQDEFPTDEEEEESSLPVQEGGLPQPAAIEKTYCYPPLTLLKKETRESNNDVSAELQSNATKLIETLASFGVEATILNIARGPAVTRYEISPKAGTKVSKIVNLADDIALNLAASGIRIEAPIPGKPAVGIEVPNQTVDSILLRSIIDTREFKEARSKVSAALGRDISGTPIIADLAKMPHVLIAGATGSGKSVCINTIITSILYKATPDEVKLLMVDPKVVELGVYNGIPHLLIPVVTDPKKAAGALGWAVTEMLNRYKLFAESGVRDMKGYNEHVRETGEGEPLPQIVIIIDELADLMMAAPGDVEDAICRLAQMARAAGMHLVIATQRPSVDVITGVIKANIPSRISFAVSSAVDSRTILDSAGAEKLLGRGDMLYYPTGMSKPLRVQGCFISDKEVESVVGFIKKSQTALYNEKIMEEIEKAAAAREKSGEGGSLDDSDDEMALAAIDVVVEAGMASVSLLQRRLKLGYARAARIIDELEERGIVGPYEGSKPRQVLISKSDWMEMKARRAD
ncbi:MAG: DNA translocase FtsK [Eubacteriales bacterium]|jgi:S-DNA-T family DNA segregation ATPase FtsK/SpoIIIE